MQLPQAFIQFEPGTDRALAFPTDWQGERVVPAVECFQPCHASLTNLALPVVENAVHGKWGGPSFRRGGGFGK